MEDNWAAEHLQTIRTLMERVALYRRALSPVMFLTGIIGLIFSLCGVSFNISSPLKFVIWWLFAGLLAFIGTLLITRKQALKEQEPFWSGPTKRVINSLIPPLYAGVSLGVCGAVNQNLINPYTLPLMWIIFYGVALFSAGFFMQRGMKLFGALFVLTGGILIILFSLANIKPDYKLAHYLMGLFFGAIHIAYGIYLRFTEKSSQTK